MKLDSNRILPSSLTKLDPDSEFKEAPSGSNLLSGRDSNLDSNAKLHNSARHEQPFYQTAVDQENINMNSRMSQLSQIEEEDLRVDRRRVLGEINVSNDQNIARSRRNTNRSSQQNKENSEPKQQSRPSQERDFDAIEQIRRESIDIKINPYQMYQQINRLSVIFDSSNARFACLKEINYTCSVCLLQFAKNDHLVQLS